MRRFSLLFVVPILFLSSVISAAQGTSNVLQSGSSTEKDLRAGQTHSYIVNLEREQFLQVAIQPGGLEVVVRVFCPTESCCAR